MTFLQIIRVAVAITLMGAHLAFAAGPTVKALHGAVMVAGKPATVGMEVGSGVEVHAVNKDSHVELIYPSGHVLRLVHGKMRIKDMDDKKSLFALLSGKLFSYVRKLGADEDIRIETRSGVMGVRGTKYMVEELPDQTYVCVCEGVVGVTNARGKTDVKAGEDSFVFASKTPVAQEASVQMFDMVADVFKDMGFPVGKRP